MEQPDSDNLKLPRCFRLSIHHIMILNEISRRFRMHKTAILEELIESISFLLQGHDFYTIKGEVRRYQGKRRADALSKPKVHARWEEGRKLIITIDMV